MDVNAQSRSQDVAKSFIRSVRRISIVGRHKRQKSRTMVPPVLGRPSLGSQLESMAVSAQEAVMDVDSSGLQEPQQLLPPVEIQIP